MDLNIRSLDICPMLQSKIPSRAALIRSHLCDPSSDKTQNHQRY